MATQSHAVALLMQPIPGITLATAIERGLGRPDGMEGIQQGLVRLVNLGHRVMVVANRAYDFVGGASDDSIAEKLTLARFVADPKHRVTEIERGEGSDPVGGNEIDLGTLR